MADARRRNIFHAEFSPKPDDTRRLLRRCVCEDKNATPHSPAAAANETLTGQSAGSGCAGTGEARPREITQIIRVMPGY